MDRKGRRTADRAEYATMAVEGVKSMTTHNDKPGARPLINDGGGFVLKCVKILVLIITSVHLVIAGVIFYNYVTSPEILCSGDNAWLQTYYQYSKGDYCYYPRSSLYAGGAGYTPLCAQIFGWTIRFMGNDVRYVRMVSGLFGFGAILLISLSVYRFTRSRFYAFAAAGLMAGMALGWFIGVGANSIHLAFSILGVYLLIRDEKVGWRTALLATAAFFASFWAKQTGLPHLVIALGYITFRDWRKGLVCSFVAMVIGGAGILYFASLPDSDFIWQVFKEQKNHMLIWSRLWEMMFPMWFRQFGVLLAFAVTGILMLAVTSPRKLLAPQFLLLAAGFAMGNVAACKYGSGFHQAWFSISLLILVMATFMAHFVAQKQCSELLVCALLAVQSLMIVDFNVPSVLINDNDKQRYKAIMNILNTPGKETYYINQGYYNILLGKKWYGCIGADCWNNGVWSASNYPPEVREFLQTDPWDIVIIDVPLEDGSFVLYERLNKAYKPVLEIPPAPRFANTWSLRWKKVVFERVKPRP